MAYTNNYDKLMADIAATGQQWSDYDLALAKENPDAGRSILTQKNRYGATQDKTERLAANSAAERIRQQYGGYSGGRDGGGFTLSDKYAPPVEAYTSPYGEKMDAALDALLHREAFSYHPGKDPSYQAYAEKYRNLGDRAREDALGSAAAMTGGQLSSFALTAGQQAQNGYNAQLTDKIPALEQLAYEMYRGEQDGKRADLSALQGLDETAYGRHRDMRGDALTNYQLNYGVGRDDLSDLRYEDETGYQRDLTGREEQRQQDAARFERAMAKWQTTGTLDAESAAVLALPAGSRTLDYQNTASQMEARRASGGGSGGGSRKKQDGDEQKKPKISYSGMTSAIARGEMTPEVLHAFEYYNGIPYQQLHATDDAGVEALKTELMGYRSDNGKVVKIERELKAGHISEEQSEQLAAYFNLI